MDTSRLNIFYLAFLPVHGSSAHANNPTPLSRAARGCRARTAFPFRRTPDTYRQTSLTVLYAPRTHRGLPAFAAPPMKRKTRSRQKDQLKNDYQSQRFLLPQGTLGIKVLKVSVFFGELRAATPTFLLHMAAGEGAYYCTIRLIVPIH